MKTDLRALIVEDEEDDARLLVRELTKGDYNVHWQRVDTEPGLRDAFARETWDIVLCDYVLPRFSGEAALRIVRESGLDLPFIFVSGTIGEDTAVAAMKAGAHDYIMKGQLKRLVAAVRRELLDAQERKLHRAAEMQLRMSEHKYRHLFQSMSEAALLVSEENGKIIDANEQAELLFGRSRGELLGTPSISLFPVEAAPSGNGPTSTSTRHSPGNWETLAPRKAGPPVPVHVSVSRVHLHNRPFLLTLVRNISQRKRAETELRKVLRHARTIVAYGVATAPENWRPDDPAADPGEVYWEWRFHDEDAAREVLPLKLASGASYREGWRAAMHPDDRETMARIAKDAFATGAPSWQHDFRCIDAEGNVRWFTQSATVESVEPGRWQVVTINTDVTERRRLEEQYRQAQKMDAIGQLAGGIAHDFNNMLTVIQMHASLLLLEKPASPRDSKGTGPGVQPILQACERASNLTRQLLTFSRRQAKSARALDLGEVLGVMLKLLRRIVGEEICLETRFAPKLPLVHADPGMMEQVLMNLIVNARDAMAGGGRLTVSLDALSLDTLPASAPSSARPGSFVRLQVSDTGCGIPEDVRSRIFEPFFTTKAIGHGTGLGLATVFGIVEQHSGWIEVSSEVGCGTTFGIFLPALESGAAAARDRAQTAEVKGGEETILLVEDDHFVRGTAATALRQRGYTVIEAGNAEEAKVRWQERNGAIDLLFTDLVLPGGITGQMLADDLLQLRPNLPVIYASGYSADVLSGRLQVKPGVTYLRKPYSFLEITSIVRRRLDGVSGKA